MPTRKKPDVARQTVAERGGGVQGKPLSYEQISLILKLRNDEKTQVQIAEIMEINQGTVSRILSEFTDTTGIAKIRLRGAAELMAERVITASEVAAARGDASPALEVLDRIDALPKKREGKDSSGPRVVVVVGSVTPPQITVDVDTVALPEATIHVVD